MPPRPRPRPANRQASDQTAASSSRSVPIAKTNRELELDKGDELFLRNRNMTAKDWKKVDRRTKGESGYFVDALLNNADACVVEQVGQSSDGNSDVEEVSDASSGTPRKRRKARQRDESDLPGWTRNVDIR